MADMYIDSMADILAQWLISWLGSWFDGSIADILIRQVRYLMRTFGLKDT
jgi:hypothetical protein